MTNEHPGFALMKAEVHGLEWALVRSANPHHIHFLPVTMEEAQKRRKTNNKLGSCAAGSGHDCLLKGITVAFDVYLDQSMHRQLLRYRFVDVVSSMSLEHNWKEVLFDPSLTVCIDPLMLESLRAAYQVCIDRDEEPDKRWFLRNMPMGVMLGMSFRCNYLALKTIYAQRKNHSHPGWRRFCEEIRAMPYFTELTQKGMNE